MVRLLLSSLVAKMRSSAWYGICILWHLPVLLLYGIAVQYSALPWNPAFLLLGAAATVWHTFKGFSTGLKRPEEGQEGTDGRRRIASILVSTSADLFALVLVKQGLVQMTVEMSRGNLLGAMAAILIVTPLTAMLVRAMIKALGRKLDRRRQTPGSDSITGSDR